MTALPYLIDWSSTSKADLKNIHKYLSEISEITAKKVIHDIVEAPKSIRFPEQYQVEEYFPECRRISIRNYKILYTFDKVANSLHIVRVFDTRQNPKMM